MNILHYPQEQYLVLNQLRELSKHNTSLKFRTNLVARGTFPLALKLTSLVYIILTPPMDNSATVYTSYLIPFTKASLDLTLITPSPHHLSPGDTKEPSKIKAVSSVL